jgi:hypothetical protein
MTKHWWQDEEASVWTKISFALVMSGPFVVLAVTLIVLVLFAVGVIA